MDRSVTGISALMVAAAMSLACQGSVDGRPTDPNGKEPPDGKGTGGTGMMPKPGDKPDESTDAARRRQRRGRPHAPADRRPVPEHRRDLLGIEDAVPAERAAGRRRHRRSLHQQRADARCRASTSTSTPTPPRPGRQGGGEPGPAAALRSASRRRRGLRGSSSSRASASAPTGGPLTASETERLKTVYAGGRRLRHGHPAGDRRRCCSRRSSSTCTSRCRPSAGGKVVGVDRWAHGLAPVLLLPRHHARRGPVHGGRERAAGQRPIRSPSRPRG